MGFGNEKVTLPGIRCIFLDLGRVLVDLDIARFGNRLKELAGVQPEELLTAVLGDALASGFETGRISEAEFHALVCKRLGKQIARDDFFAAWNSVFLPVPILPDDLIARLAQRVPLWALSNTNRVHYNFLAGRYTFFRYFTGRILSFEVGFQKPDERIFRRALAQAGTEASAALFVDDLLSNVEAARALGIDAFQFLNPDGFVREMRARRLLLPDD